MITYHKRMKFVKELRKIEERFKATLKAVDVLEKRLEEIEQRFKKMRKNRE